MGGEGLLSRLDHRVKALAAVAVAVAAALVPQNRIWIVLVYLGALAGLGLFSGVKARIILRRLAGFGPFVAVAVVLLPFTRRGDGTASAVIHVWGLPVVLYREGLLAAASVLANPRHRRLLSCFSSPPRRFPGS